VRQVVRVRRQHADDRERHVVEQDAAAQHVRITAEGPPPRTVREHGDGNRASGPVLVGAERPAQRRAEADQLEVVRRHEVGGRALRLSIGRQVDVLPVEEQRNSVEGGALDGHVLHVEVRDREPSLVDAAELHRDESEPVGARIRQRLEEGGVRQRQDAGVRPDPECDHERGSRGESRVATQMPKPESDITQDRSHQSVATRARKSIRRGRPPCPARRSAHAVGQRPPADRHRLPPVPPIGPASASRRGQHLMLFRQVADDGVAQRRRQQPREQRRGEARRPRHPLPSTDSSPRHICVTVARESLMALSPARCTR